MKRSFFTLLILLSGLPLYAQKEKIVNVAPAMQSLNELSADSLNVGAEVIAAEKEFWAKWKIRDAKGIEKYLSEGVLSFNEDGSINTKDMLLNVAADYQLSDYQLEHFKAIVLDKNTAIVVYKATQVGTYKGVAISSAALNCSTTWIKRNKRWQIAFHQATPLRLAAQ